MTAPARPRLAALAAGLFLLAAVLAAYAPAQRGAPVWDDDFHLTRPDLRSARGLARIWFQPGATAQYYPVAHTAFWIEHRLWGDAVLGYHLANELLHAASACLAAALLLRLGLGRRAAWLAAGLFALHPVMAESVAWISEQKNALSGFFYLAAALAYLRFARTRSPGAWAGATVLFLLALGSKSVTATLPAALLVALWWRNGRIDARRDLLPLAPWFAAGIAGGLYTAWFERQYIGARGAAHALGAAQRLLIAGRAPWFYLGKLAWPARLAFIYPRWDVDPRQGWQWIFPLATLLVLAGLAGLARRARGPLAGALFFLGTLFPALGFFNVYPFLFSFVADHFQYLASLGIFALAAAAWARLPAGAGLGVAALALAGLGALTFRQSGEYRDAETLYRATLERNPGCWLADTNLGIILQERGRPADALPYFAEALRLHPGSAEEHVDLGNALAALGRDGAALLHYQQAVRLDPDYPQARYDYGIALEKDGQEAQAIAEYREAVRLDPGDVKAHGNLARALRQAGQAAAAAAEFREVLRLRPGSPEARIDLANLDRLAGDLAGAERGYRAALAAEPRSAAAHYDLAALLAATARMPEAAAELETALRLQPDYPEAEDSLGNALLSLNRPQEALAHYRKAAALAPKNGAIRYNLALLLHRLGQEPEALAQLAEARRLGFRPGR
ncbi:MAG TPA: tetratricopeptide repeat protein [Opitutaceae bacterium]|nr:tetratricopeptide repeat protein [Opitutaceae bacterium]